MMDRRTFTGAAVLVVLTPSLAAVAQGQPAKVPRIGLLVPQTRLSGRSTFRDGMAELGYVDGRNVILDYRYADFRADRMPALAAELVRSNVDVIVAISPPAIAAAMKATATIPIVMSFSESDPVASGFVHSLARPGGNVTGVTILAAALTGKRLELLKAVRPSATRIAQLLNAQNPGNEDQRRSAELAARQLGVEFHAIEVADPVNLDEAFTAMARDGTSGVVVAADPAFSQLRQRIVELAAKHRLPAMYVGKQFVEAGGLMSYGPNLADVSRLVAAYVDKILKGAKPGDLPVEQPTKFELVINVKTARALAITIPQSLLLRADEVIQ
jgi:putative tryptophan/tyrosine transport system substrate-binding protein